MLERIAPHRGLILAVLLVVALAVAGFVLRDELFGGETEQAERRTTGAAPTIDDDIPDVTTGEPPRPTGSDPAIGLETVVELPGPVALADPRGPGPVLVATLDGRVHAVDLDGGTAEVVLDLSSQISTGGERGLLGMAIDPAGERLYLDYTDVDGDTDIRSWPLVDGLPTGGPTDGVLHLELGQPFANHNGGHLSFGPDGLLWIGTGDGGSGGDPQDLAQDPSSLLGKMLRVRPEPTGGVAAPADNPDWDGRPEIWGIGLRNPWRYSFDRATNRLWIADVGQNAVEEVSVVDVDEPMPNFGWNEVEGDQDFEGTSDPAFVSPVVTYGRDLGCSITGGYVYRGDAIESLYGWYLFGDYCGGWIRAVPADAPTEAPTVLAGPPGPDSEPDSEPSSVIGFGELEDGELLVFDPGGVRRIVPG